MQPSDFLASISRDSGSPRQRLTSMQGLVLSRPHVLLLTRGALEIDHRLSVRPVCFEEKRGPPGLLGRPLRACRDATPRRMRPLLAPTPLRGDLRRGHCCLQVKESPGHPGSHSFRGHLPTARTLACLRIARLVTETGARLTTGSDGLTPSRAGFAPAGRQTKFHGVNRSSSNSNRPAEPGRTLLPMPSPHLACGNSCHSLPDSVRNPGWRGPCNRNRGISTGTSAEPSEQTRAGWGRTAVRRKIGV